MPPQSPPLITGIIFQLLSTLLWLYTWAFILAAIVSTLLSFGILDTRNRFVWSVNDLLYRVTEPALRPIRRVLPSFGGIDFSPWVAILLLRLVVAPVLAGLYSGMVYGVWQPLF